jgi:sarcosine dehydrogenase
MQTASAVVRSAAARGRARAIRAPTARTLSSEADFPTEADVVVVGGGSLGGSTLYHLAKMGVNAVLVEKDQITAGTTWHSAGLVWRLRPNDTEIALLDYTRHLAREVLEAETGQSPGWIENGGIFIANNPERFDEYRRLHTVGRALGIESHLLTPEETKGVYPLMNVDDVYGALFSPGDGTVDPSGITAAYCKGARQAGARVIEGCAVTGVDVDVSASGRRSVVGVRTNRGTIRTSKIVNCAGAWAPELGAMAGVSVPLVAMKHAYVVTEPIPGVQGLPNIRDHDLSVYMKLQGDCLAIGGYEQDPTFWTADPEFAFGLFDLDYNVFAAHIENHIKRVPAVEAAGISSTVCGPESFTADHKPLMGEAPEVRGFFLGCGFNSAGMMLGGGCGRELAQWVVRGFPDLDMFGYDINRFHPTCNEDLKWVADRSHESYAKNYAMVFPHDQPLAGRQKRTDPLFNILTRQGCVWQERLGWERPGYFVAGPGPDSRSDAAAVGSGAESSGAVSSGAESSGAAAVRIALPYDYYGAYAAFAGGAEEHDGTEEAEDRLAGRVPGTRGWSVDMPALAAHDENPFADRLRSEYSFAWPTAPFHGAPEGVHGLVKNEVLATRERVALFNQSYFGKFFLSGPDALAAAQWLCTADVDRPVGSTVYTNMLNAEGRSMADLTVSRLLPQPGTSIDEDRFYIAAGGGSAQHDWCWIRGVLEDKDFDATLTDETEKHGMISVQGPKSRALLQRLCPDDDLGDEAFPFSTNRVLTCAGHIVRAIRLTFVGELGFELHVPKTGLKDVYRALKKEGARFGVADAGYRAIDVMSAEKNYKHWHEDLRPDDTPLEAGLAFACKLKTDVDFLGRAALEAQRERGIKRRLAAFTVPSDVPLFGLEGVYRDGESVGYLRRAAPAFSVDRTIGFAYVERPASDDSGKNVTPKWIREGTYELDVMGKRIPAEVHTRAVFDPDGLRIRGVYDRAAEAPAAVEASMK